MKHIWMAAMAATALGSIAPAFAQDAAPDAKTATCAQAAQSNEQREKGQSFSDVGMFSVVKAYLAANNIPDNDANEVKYALALDKGCTANPDSVMWQILDGVKKS